MAFTINHETTINYTDGYVVFKDGKMTKEYSLKEIRDRLWDGKFYD